MAQLRETGGPKPLQSLGKFGTHSNVFHKVDTLLGSYREVT